jgi:4-hydroxythreonine-4-phosphate dehydrogenase
MQQSEPERINTNRKGFIGITMGCPVGIGPEVILRFFAGLKILERHIPVVIGDMEQLKRCSRELQINVDIGPWMPGAPPATGKLQVIEPAASGGYQLNSALLQWGEPSRETGRATLAYITEAVHLTRMGKLEGIVTGPIAKHAIQSAGCRFPGHTEMLASLCRVKNYGMMMAGNRLKVSLVTIHTPVAKVSTQLSREEITRVINLTGETLMRDFALARPRIAVAGLNPHSGESGLFGEEEIKIIEPAVRAADTGKWQVSGPHPPDTVFMQALANKYDAVVAMYHDQGLIPFKLVHFEDGVNLTMGLPIVRTSVDHGTAYDIAGKGIASASSLEAAFFMAAHIIDNRKANIQYQRTSGDE